MQMQLEAKSFNTLSQHCRKAEAFMLKSHELKNPEIKTTALHKLILIF
jgi:hypothetical protein